MNNEQMKYCCAILSMAGCLGSLGVGQAADLMGAAQETAVVQRYCGSCHSDALMYGGLSVQHFDAALPDPTLTAMLLSKITNGHTPRDVSTADSAEVLKMMRASAMGAAGQGVPDEETQVTFSRALALQSKGAYEWNVRWEDAAESSAGSQDRTLIASILREKPSVKHEGATDSYRLIVRCRPNTREGEIKIAWANPPAEEGQMMSVSIDSTQAFQHKVEGGRAQGNGNNGPGATVLKVALPLQSLTIGNLFADGNLVFPFGELSQAARRDLSACFPAPETAH
jgi:hypothetical protein